MNITREQIRSYRLHVHHLDQKLPAANLMDAAGACGLQNSPPGAWETALFHRLENCTLQDLHIALYEQKSLLQAWSYRGVPVVFPTSQSGVFLSPLIARKGESPWIYTRGITAGLDFMKMSFDELLPLAKKAATHLNSHTIKSKETLDKVLADLIQKDLPLEKQALWGASSMYGSPDKQTVGGAIVSFLLRPCSFFSLVVFGRRQGVSPTFTSFQNWLGRGPSQIPYADKELVRKFLHCYGPATVASFQSWLGCSPQQAKRLWGGIADEMESILADGKTGFMLSADRKELFSSAKSSDQLILLGAHDPYLDIKDRDVILENKSLHKAVWKTVANPGAVLKGGRIIGTWRQKVQDGKLALSIFLFEPLSLSEQKKLKDLAEEYASFRLLNLKCCTLEFGP